MVIKKCILISLLCSVIVVCLFFSVCSESSNTIPENNSKIVILCAFAPEINALLAEMCVQSTEILCGRACHIGILGGKNVFLIATGINMVNAAMLAQAVIMRYSLPLIMLL